jgi:hypothetical protein
VREAVAFLLLACACGAATLKGRAEDVRRDGEDRRSEAASSPVGGPARDVASVQTAAGWDRGFVTLEGRASVLAPGLRQAAERESAGEPTELVRAAVRDACVRVAFESGGPVTARLIDDDGGVLAETKAPALEGALGERGPVCVRKGDAVSAVAEGATARVKWIAWVSP